MEEPIKNEVDINSVPYQTELLFSGMSYKDIYNNYMTVSNNMDLEAFIISLLDTRDFVNNFLKTCDKKDTRLFSFYTKVVTDYNLFIDTAITTLKMGFEPTNFQIVKYHNIRNNHIVSLDLETDYNSKIISLQTREYTKSFAIPINKITVNGYYCTPNPSAIYIGHNIKFDFKTLYFNCYSEKKFYTIYDTFVAEDLLTKGKKDIKKSAEEVAFRYLKNKVRLNKPLREKFNGITIGKFRNNQDLNIYAANDTAFVLPVLLQQLVKLHKEDLLLTFLFIECPFINTIISMETEGIKLDVNAWRELSTNNTIKLENTRLELESIIRNDINLRKKYVEKSYQTDLFVETFPKCTINWNSPAQIKSLFSYIGLDIEKADEKTLNVYSYKYPLVKKYLEFKQMAKLVSTYGENIIDLTDGSNIIRSTFKQSVDTGRLSSNNPNLQNLPAYNEYRNCFIPRTPKGVFVDADYASQEIRLAAFGSKDPIWVDALTSGKDLHSEIASIVFNVPIETVRDKQERFKGKSYRDVAKTINFALIYGASKYRLSAVLGISVDEAQKVIDDYFAKIYKLKEYLQTCANYGLTNGYIRSFRPFGIKRYLNGWNKYLLNNPQQNINTIESIKRDCFNTPIQATGAMMVKLACNLYNYTKASDSYIILTVHDQIIIETSEDIKNIVKEELVQCMKIAGKIFIDSIPVEVDAKITKKWEK
jgi:DNA polymerase-1